MAAEDDSSIDEFMIDEKNTLEKKSINTERLVDLIHEIGMLRHTPRTGYQFLGTGKENVAEHSYRTAVIGYILAKMANIDSSRIVMMCLFHDLHEARTGDFNYVNHIYNTSRSRIAVEDAIKGTGIEDAVLGFVDEIQENTSIESILANDADQLDFIFNLYQQKALGNSYADKWLSSAIARLHSNEAIQLAQVASSVDPSNWWYKAPDDSWWINHSIEKI